MFHCSRWVYESGIRQTIALWALRICSNTSMTRLQLSTDNLFVKTDKEVYTPNLQVYTEYVCIIYISTWKWSLILDMILKFNVFSLLSWSMWFECYLECTRLDSYIVCCRQHATLILRTIVENVTNICNIWGIFEHIFFVDLFVEKAI